MKIVLTESQYNRLFKSGPSMEKAIISYLNNLMKGATRKIQPKSRNYGNLREDWCKDGKEFMSVHYYFGKMDEDENVINKNFFEGQVYISEHIVNSISSLFNIRKKFIYNVIAEWYDENYTQKFAKEMNEPYLHINDAEGLEKEYDCSSDIEIPDDISDEEMINFIDKNTAYSRDEIINLVNSGERDLKDFYLDILETVDRHKRYGF
jgi:hypothetical protein